LRKGFRAAAALLGVLALAILFAPGAAVAGRDDTAWLQAKLDAGGKIFLPKLAGGDCYATHGLWVSHSGTRLGSNGACIVYLGPGPVRLHSSDGDPMPANAIFVVNRSSTRGAPPRSVVISDLTLIVPIGTDGYGVVVAGTQVTLANLSIDGVPVDGVTVTGRGNGLGYSGPVKIRNTVIRGAQRNGISVVSASDVVIDGNTITGVGLIGMTNPELGPWAGIDVEPDVASYPIRRVRITRNTISGNAGAGVLLALETGTGRPGVADQIALSGNAITFNGVLSGPWIRGGVCLQGGQSDGRGTLRLVANEIAGNGGYGLCSDDSGYAMQIALMCNVIHDNAYGDSQWGDLSGLTVIRAEQAARSGIRCS
jgi:parallel beta helix pectate lyase-like protein